MSHITPNIVQPRLRDPQGHDLQTGDTVLFAHDSNLFTGCIMRVNVREGWCHIAETGDTIKPMYKKTGASISRQATTYRGYNPTLLKELFPHRKEVTYEHTNIPW